MTMLFDKSVLCPILVGRALILDSIQQRIELARSGKGQAFLLAGEAGIGKSRLIAELKTRATSMGMSTLEGQCFESDRAIPYAPLLDLLRAYCHTRAPDELVRDFGADAPELVKLLPEFAALFPRLVPPPALEPEQEKHRLIQALLSFFARLAKSFPLLIVVEDLHWGDEASLDFWGRLARHVSSLPIFLLTTYRSDEVSPSLARFLEALNRERRADEIILSRLIREEVAGMIHAIFEQPRPARAEFVDAIFALTEGNPFFVEEVLKALVTAGDIYFAEADGIWTRRPMSELRIPRSAQEAVQRRSAQLSSGARETLAIAAVAGRRFDFGLLQQLTGRAEAELLALLKELIAAQLIVEETADRFAFRHALTRQAVYAGLLVRERQSLHRVVAETMERIHTESSTSYVADLAYHFYEAQAWEKALEYSRRAGENAQAMYAPRAAVEHFTRALESANRFARSDSPLLSGERLRMRLHRARGLAYATLGEFDPARADHEAALALAQKSGDRCTREAWQALLDLGLLWSERDYAQSGVYCERALELARGMGDPSALAHSLNRLGNWHLNRGQPLEAMGHHREALGIFQELNDQRGLAQTLDLLGMAAMQSGDLIQSQTYYEQAAALFEALDDRQGLASSLTSLAFIGGTYQLEIAERAVRVANGIGWRAGEAYALLMLGSGLGFQGDYARALDSIRGGLAIAEEIEHREWTTAGHCFLGALYLDLLILTEAQEHLERALALAKEINSGYWIQAAAIRLVETCLAQQSLALAKATFASAFGIEAETESMNPMALLAQTELALAAGNGELAWQCVDRVMAFMANAPDNFMTPLLYKWRGEALTMLRREDEAETTLLAALKSAEALGLPPTLWRIHLALGDLYRAHARRADSETAFASARSIIADLAAGIPEADLRKTFLRRAAETLPSLPQSTPLRNAKKEFGGLTAREREVAALLAQGKSNREIAEALFVGERTVEAHIGSILSKLGFASRSQIAVWAVEKGLK